jgi:hypothetical protein
MVNPWIYGFYFGGALLNIFNFGGNTTHMFITYQVVNNSVVTVKNYIVPASDAMSTHII